MIIIVCYVIICHIVSSLHIIFQPVILAIDPPTNKHVFIIFGASLDYSYITFILGEIHPNYGFTRIHISISKLLNPEICHNTNFVVTGGTKSLHNNNNIPSFRMKNYAYSSFAKQVSCGAEWHRKARMSILYCHINIDNGQVHQVLVFTRIQIHGWWASNKYD